jgi:hypothetical protein
MADEDIDARVRRIKATALLHCDKIHDTYYALWDKHNPQTDNEQAEIEPMTVDALEAEIGELAAEAVDYVIFGNLPHEYDYDPDTGTRRRSREDELADVTEHRLLFRHLNRA